MTLGRLVEQVHTHRRGEFLLQTGINAVNPVQVELLCEETLSLWRHVLKSVAGDALLLRHHLDGGIAKGALTPEVADKKWNDWKAERDSKIEAKKTGLKNAAIEARKAAKAEEAKVNEARAEALAKKAAELAAKEAAEKAAAEAPAEEAAPVEEAPAEA